MKTKEDIRDAKLSLIWNDAVHNVGGTRNTRHNFKVIAKEFYKLGKDKGYSINVLEEYAKGNLEATQEWMEWD